MTGRSGEITRVTQALGPAGPSPPLCSAPLFCFSVALWGTQLSCGHCPLPHLEAAAPGPLPAGVGMVT